jgi:hypothetical protein
MAQNEADTQAGAAPVALSWTERELAELHSAAIGAAVRAARTAANWGATERPVIGPSRLRFSQLGLAERVLLDLPRHAIEALALVWPLLALVALASLDLSSIDLVPRELRRGVLAVLLAVMIPLTFHLWARQRGGAPQRPMLGTLLRFGPRELTAVLVTGAVLAASALIGIFVAALLQAFHFGDLATLGGGAVAGLVVVQWSAVVAALARDDHRSPFAVQRDALPALPMLLALAALLAVGARFVVPDLIERVMAAPQGGPVDLVLIGYAALLLLGTMVFAGALAYAVQATAEA